MSPVLAPFYWYKSLISIDSIVFYERESKLEKPLDFDRVIVGQLTYYFAFLKETIDTFTLFGW